MTSMLRFPGVDPGEFAGGDFVRVVIERGIEGGVGVDGLTYRLRRGVSAQVGDRVEVPLGRNDRRSQGLVVEVGGDTLCDGREPATIKLVTRVVGGRVPPDMIELARWIAAYYVAPLGMVLGAMVPAAVKRQVGRREIAMLERASEPPAEGVDALTARARRTWDLVAAIEPESFPMRPGDLARRVGERTVAIINRLVDAGLLRRVTTEDVRARAPAWSEARFEGAAPRTPPVLTPAQERVVEGVAGTLGRFAPHLLRGVTGSGKTEVYLRVIARVLETGGSAIVLVPEIALTPQTAGRFIDRFGRGRPGGVAVLHSALTAAQRHREWAAARSGEARVVIGARSAVFAPVPSLGLIVVDEEHDGSYKQDQVPRYHARDVAVKRAQLAGCPVLLGSATPSLESWANSEGPAARFTRWELPDRAGGARLPRVEIVDLVEERRARARADAARRERDGGGPRDNRVHLLGPRLEDAIDRTLAAGAQVLLLLNRRGYANYICCPDGRCGWVLLCEQCDTTMVYHKTTLPGGTGGTVRCHHCQAEQLLPARCPVCARAASTFGLGTQRVEEELLRTFGARHALVEGATMLRVDSDTMRTGADYFSALSRFAAGEVRLLVGTQMIAKGLDVPGVTLVGVVNADTALNLPDFRASERTFQLVSQVAGRAGRGRDAGLVIVQTMSPTAPAIRTAAAHDYTAFADGELALRRAAGLPPASAMARIVVRDPDHVKAQRDAATLAAELRASAASDPATPAVAIRGPMPCPLSRIAGHHRVAVELLAPRRAVLQRLLAGLRARGLLTSDARTAVDIDPVALL